jgi:hypothetical protein
MQKRPFLAKKCDYPLKKPVNLPGIVILLSSMVKYAKIDNKVVLEAFFNWKNCARR